MLSSHPAPEGHKLGSHAYGRNLTLVKWRVFPANSQATERHRGIACVHPPELELKLAGDKPAKVTDILHGCNAFALASLRRMSEIVYWSNSSLLTPRAGAHQNATSRSASTKR